MTKTKKAKRATKSTRKPKKIPVTYGVSTEYRPPELVESESWATLRPQQKAFLRALYRRPNNWTYAARCALVVRRTPYNWKNDEPEFAAALAEVQAALLDSVRECFADGASRDWKAAKEYLERYEEIGEQDHEQEVLIVVGDAPPERLAGG